MEILEVTEKGKRILQKVMKIVLLRDGVPHGWLWMPQTINTFVFNCVIYIAMTNLEEKEWREREYFKRDDKFTPVCLTAFFFISQCFHSNNVNLIIFSQFGAKRKMQHIWDVIYLICMWLAAIHQISAWGRRRKNQHGNLSGFFFILQQVSEFCLIFLQNSAKVKFVQHYFFGLSCTLWLWI